MPRRAIRDFSFKGFAIPAGTLVGVNPLFTHHMAEIWPDPNKFDPMRFTEEAQRNRHRFAWYRWRRRAYVPRAAFCLYAGEMLCRHFLQNVPSRWYQATSPMADVADTEAARRIAGGAEAGVSGSGRRRRV